MRHHKNQCYVEHMLTIGTGPNGKRMKSAEEKSAEEMRNFYSYLNNFLFIILISFQNYFASIRSMFNQSKRSMDFDAKK